MHILLIDDSLKHRRSGVRDLEALGHTVVAHCDYGEARAQAKREPFDVALIDLLMPAEPTTLGTEAIQEYVGREIAVGFPLVLELSLLGIPRIVVATDTNHHNHPMSAVVDWFGGRLQSVNGAMVKIIHCELSADGSKDWIRALATIMT